MAEIAKTFWFDGEVATRWLLIRGQKCVVGKDLADLLGAEDTGRLTRSLKSKYYFLLEKEECGIKSGTVMITEAGMWRLIMRSNRPDAERIQDWISEEVLPSIMETGSYSIADESKQIGPTATRAMKKTGRGPEFGEPRQDHVDLWKVACSLLWEMEREEAERLGRKPRQHIFTGLADCLSEGSTGMSVLQERKCLGGIKGTAVDHYDILPLHTRNLMLTALIQAMRSKTITLANAMGKFEAIKRAAKEISVAAVGEYRCVVDRTIARVPLLIYKPAIAPGRGTPPRGITA